MNTSVRYLYHSGFLVETDRHVLLFDYWRDTPKGGGLEQGVIDPAALRDRDVLVFASHRHGDHYNRGIESWRKSIPRLRLILSDDISPVAGAVMIGPGQTWTQPDCRVETLRSTDEGVAFLVSIDGLTIYHAGDLNWWHWEGEPADWNAEMGAAYRAQIDLLKGREIDLAFVPVDPRLGDQYVWGLNYLMRTLPVKYAIPMHFGEETAVVDRLLTDAVVSPYRSKILPLTTRGETIHLS
jgi:L-ascorbate metabolism protein UlaG (beta-lactamase superfamily)